MKSAGTILKNFIVMQVLLSMVAANNVFAQTQRFSVVRKGEKIGWLITAREMLDGEERLSTQTHMSLRILVELNIQAKTTNTFKNGSLERAYLKRSLNGRVKKQTEIIRRSSGYELLDGEAQKSCDQLIRKTVTSIYFEEPTPTLTKVFSETYLCYIPLVRNAPNIYATHLPDGGKMIYTYKNGRLLHIKSSTGYGEVEFVSEF